MLLVANKHLVIAAASQCRPLLYAASTIVPRSDLRHLHSSLQMARYRRLNAEHLPNEHKCVPKALHLHVAEDFVSLVLSCTWIAAR